MSRAFHCTQVQRVDRHVLVTWLQGRYAYPPAPSYEKLQPQLRAWRDKLLQGGAPAWLPAVARLEPGYPFVSAWTRLPPGDSRFNSDILVSALVTACANGGSGMWTLAKVAGETWVVVVHRYDPFAELL